MLVKKKTTRKNRLKKNIQKKRSRLMQRIRIGAKMVALMAIILAVSALFMAGYAAVTTTDYFRTQSISVSGNTRLSHNGVIAQAGIHKGDNLLAVNIKLVRKRLLAHPWIASARITREIPETLGIHISEHTPLAIVDLGRKFLMNPQGRIFKEYGQKDPSNLPLVYGIEYGDISLGDDPLSPNMVAVLDLIEACKAKNSVLPLSSIKEIHMDAQMGITLKVWNAKRIIKLGRDGYRVKIEQVAKLLPHLERHRKWRNFNAIDANNPNRIVVQL